MTNTKDVVIRDAVKGIQDLLVGFGWRRANAVGELIDPDGIKWFTATFTHGEYTVETSYRPRGSGPAQGVTRVRITPHLLQAHPRLPRELAQSLVEVDSTEQWPPAAWSEHSL